MTDKTKKIATATSLMGMALALFDEAGEGASYTACHLQAAIDAATGALPMEEGETIDTELIDRLLDHSKHQAAKGS